ncbi:hypothetical protein N8445_00600 [bacterium]|nr:hypothetical protein [bacterium]
MNIAMFIVGFFIFVTYAVLLVWNIFYSARKNKEENYPDYYARYKLDSSGKKSNAKVLQEKTKRNKTKKVKIEK